MEKSAVFPGGRIGVYRVKPIIYFIMPTNRSEVLKGHNTQHSGQFFQNELMVEIYFKSLVRAIGKALCMEFSRTPTKTRKGDKKWPLFVNKQLFQWSASITLDNNNDVLTFSHFSDFILYHIPQLA